MSICCSSRAAAITARLIGRLERNLGIQTLLVEEDAVPVSETWEEGAAADAVMILLDSVSAPAPLRREAWTGLIDHDGAPPVAFLRLGDCAYPKLLERRPFFPAGEDGAVERWLAGMLPAHRGITVSACEGKVPEEWRQLLIDAPGQVVTADVAAAQAFAQQASGHFQGVVWIGCAGRETALIRAEIDYRLREGGRMLAVLAHIDKPMKIEGGRHSYVQVVGAPPETDGDAAAGACYAPGFPGWLARELGSDLAGAVRLDASRDLYRLPVTYASTGEIRQRHLEIVHRHFQKWKSEPEPCVALLAEVPAAVLHGFAQDWVRASELCRRAAYLLLEEGRRREGIRMWHRLLVESEERGDAENAAIARHELSWLTDEDEPVYRGAPGGEQLTFDLTGVAAGT